MTIQDVLMLGVAVIGGASALLVVMARNVVHSALYLVIALLATAGTFLLLGAEFLAWAQVLVYVGAVVVLILFGLMLTRAPIGPTAQGNELGGALPMGVSLALFGFLVVVIFGSFGQTMKNIAESLDKMAAGMKPVIDTEVPLSNVGEALARMESRQVIGKIIVHF